MAWVKKERENVLLGKIRLEGGLGWKGEEPWMPCWRVWISGNRKPWPIYERGSGVIWSSDVIQKVLQELIMTSGSQLWTWILSGWLIEEEGEPQMADLTRGGFWGHSLGQSLGCFLLYLHWDDKTHVGMPFTNYTTVKLSGQAQLIPF